MLGTDVEDKTMNCCYDYDKQVWIEGEAATTLRREQLKKELGLLKSERGSYYAQSVGMDRVLMIMYREQELIELA